MKKLLAVFFSLVFLAGIAEARLKPADKNKDGVIDAKEKHMKKRMHWRHAKSKVNTKVEKQYDANKDGVIDSEEAKTMKEDAGK